jgi:hypothetical protein
MYLPLATVGIRTSRHHRAVVSALQTGGCVNGAHDVGGLWHKRTNHKEIKKRGKGASTGGVAAG